jgi:NifU-like protein involved in Fe-S cluster formation
MKYPSQLQHYFHHRHHGGRLEPAVNVRSAQVGNADNGEVLVLFVEYHECIVRARFQASGSIAVIAGGEFICEWLENKTWQDLSSLTPELILEALALTKTDIHVANLIATAVNKLRGGQA